MGDSTLIVDSFMSHNTHPGSRKISMQQERRVSRQLAIKSQLVQEAKLDCHATFPQL